VSTRYYLFLILLLFVFASCTSVSPQVSPTNTTAPPTSTEPPSTALVPTDTLEPTIMTTAKPTFAPPLAVTEAGQVWVNPVDRMEMVGVPAGEYTMGSTKGREDEGPPHVFLSGFFLHQQVRSDKCSI